MYLFRHHLFANNLVMNLSRDRPRLMPMLALNIQNARADEIVQLFGHIESFAADAGRAYLDTGASFTMPITSTSSITNRNKIISDLCVRKREGQDPHFYVINDQDGMISRSESDAAKISSAELEEQFLAWLKESVPAAFIEQLGIKEDISLFAPDAQSLRVKEVRQLLQTMADLAHHVNADKASVAKAWAGSKAESRPTNSETSHLETRAFWAAADGLAAGRVVVTQHEDKVDDRVTLGLQIEGKGNPFFVTINRDGGLYAGAGAAMEQIVPAEFDKRFVAWCKTNFPAAFLQQVGDVLESMENQSVPLPSAGAGPSTSP